MHAPSLLALARNPTIADVIAHRAVTAVYQPVADLTSGAVVAYEALARGPRGTTLERPDMLFAAAAADGRTVELDRLCREVALRGAGHALAAPWTLFVNVEPVAAPPGVTVTRHSGDLLGPGLGPGPRVVAEITERNLTSRPAELLRMVERFRARGWGIALDDLGADPGSLALLPLLRPDVIKLDLRLVQDRPSQAIAEIASAVNAEAERSGAVVLAEGIETDEQAMVARSLGATLGQGWLLGRPGPLPSVLPPSPLVGVPIGHVRPGNPMASPFEGVAARRTVRSATKRLLIAMSKHIEGQALASPAAAVVLAAFQERRFFTPATRRRYSRPAEHATFVGTLGADLDPEPAAGVRGAHLHADDPVRGEWDIAVVGPHFAAALVARDLGDDGPQDDRRFEYILTHDRDLVVGVAGDLMARMLPDPPPVPA
ncbi:EAL domain-containing protein [Cellulomonas fimi]|uniref:EAL domain-containing protein n=1 Tax=Cellulomonas fimi TaxID=1708 RepID=A0A7Y0LX33_CELFI|nr:EAL domain-containing protein [Cellulomonas fimi]